MPGQPQPDAPVAAAGPQPITDTALAALTTYKQAVDNAAQSKAAAARQLAGLQTQLSQTAPQTGGYKDANGQSLGVGETPNPAYTQLTAQVERAMSLYDSAAREHQKALADYADAAAKAVQQSDPTNRATLQAVASKAETDAQTAAAQYQEFQQAAPDRKAAVAAQQRLTTIQADQAQLNIDLQRATDPLRKQQLQQQIDAGQATIQQAQAEAQVASDTTAARTTAANANASTAATTADVASRTAGAQVTTANETANQAGIGTQTAQATLDDLLRRIRQAPSDEQARAALETALQQGTANLQGTQAATAAQSASTDRMRALQPGEIAQQGATLANTQAQTQAGQQGTLYGLDDYIKAQQAAIAKGVMTPQQADQALQARISGTDVFSAARASNDAMMARTDQAVQQRSQDISARNQQLATVGSMANTGLGQFAAMNSFAPPGSDVVGKGLIGWLGAAQSLAGQYAPPPAVQAPPMPAFLQQFAGQAQQQAPMPQQPSAPQPQAMGPTTSAPITINIGGQPQPQPQMQPQIHTGTEGAGNPWAGGNTPAPGTTWQNPALLDKMRPATTQDVARLWGGG